MIACLGFRKPKPAVDYIHAEILATIGDATNKWYQYGDFTTSGLLVTWQASLVTKLLRLSGQTMEEDVQNPSSQEELEELWTGRKWICSCPEQEHDPHYLVSCVSD